MNFVRPLLGLLLLAAASSRAQEFQSWNEVDLTAQFKRVSLLAPFVTRVDPSLPNPQFAATGLLVSVPLVKHVEFVGGYLAADIPQSTGWAHVPVGAVGFTAKTHRISILDLNRFEKLIGYADNPVRYRNLIYFDRPLGTAARYHVFLDNEFFYNLTDRAWNQNRLQAGAGRRLAPRVMANLYYLQKNANGAAKVTYVLGSDLQISLTRPRP